MYYYCLTIRKCTPTKKLGSLNAVLDVYESYVKYLKRRYSDMHIEYHYENVVKKTGNNVHMHCMIKTESLYSIFMSGKVGYSIRLERCKSAQAWQTYITKTSRNREEIYELIKTLSEVTPSVEATEQSDEYIPTTRLV